MAIDLNWRDYREQIQLAVTTGPELEASELQDQCSNRSATLPSNAYNSILSLFFWLSNLAKRLFKTYVRELNKPIKNGEIDGI